MERSDHEATAMEQHVAPSRLATAGVRERNNTSNANGWKR
jgi:hypothetical protein